MTIWRRRQIPAAPDPVLLIASVVLVSAACSRPAASPSSTPDAPNVSSSVQQPVTHLLTATTSGFMEPEELVIRADSDLAAAWKTVHAGIPGNPPPSVDMTRNTVILVALGQHPTAGYSIKLVNITREGTGAVVHYTVTSPGPGCMTAQMITSPVDVVSAARIDGAVRFDRHEVTSTC